LDISEDLSHFSYCQANLFMRGVKKPCRELATRRVADIDMTVMQLCQKHFKIFVNENIHNMKAANADALRGAFD
jgi:hypothetical protein